MAEQLAELKKAIVEGDDNLAAELVKECLASGLAPGDILDQAVVAGIEEAGRLWRENQYFLPDIILCAEAFKAAMLDLEPRLAAGEAYQHGRVLIGTIQGDMHDLGKSIVVAMLRGAGFEVVDLGVDVPVSTFIARAKELEPDIIGLGAYMSTTMLLMRDVIKELEKEGLRDKIKVMIGGVPTSAEFAAEIGADCWGKDALEAVTRARELTGLH
ncbi:MAG: hypothetical protein PWP70_1810 [Moorella sp. (in: firmicutes)]|nr:hypothetical protein [Moorella sp. (in: firmicutes)]